MAYVDFFCLPLPKEKEAEYTKLAEKFLDFMRPHGLVDYCEAVADDVPEGKITDFYRSVNAKDGETVVAAYAVWPDKETRNKAWEAMMQDESMKQMEMPFDGMRMFWGGFRPIVSL